MVGFNFDSNCACPALCIFDVCLFLCLNDKSQDLFKGFRVRAGRIF